MGNKKKKKKKKNELTLMRQLDNNLNDSYDKVIQDLEIMKFQIAKADKMADKEIRKKMKKHPNEIINERNIRVKYRNMIVTNMEKTNLLQRIYDLFKDAVPAVITIARLIAGLIVTILNIDFVKIHIKPSTLEWMQKVYKSAMLISAPNGV